MYKIFLLPVFLILILSGNLNSQYEFVDILSNMIGDWQSTFVNSQGDTCKEEMSIEFKHSKMFIEIQIKGFVAIKPVLKYTETEYLTMDDKGNIGGFYIDDNGYWGMTQIKGKVEDDVFVLKGESKLWTDMSTWEYKDGKITIKGKTKMKDSGRESSATRIFTKKTN
jgi:hypothetical protein